MKVILSLFGIYFLLLITMYFAQEKLIFFPQKLNKEHKFRFSSTSEEILIPVDEGVLHALAFEAPKSVGTIIYFHGNAGSLESWGHVYDDFKNLNYNLFIIDYRGYGKSSGNISSEFQLQQDAKAVFLAAKNRFPEHRLVFYGRSIGTGIASWLATQQTPSLLILESPYFNLPYLVSGIYPFVPKVLVKYKLKNNEHIKELNIPIHLIHGTNDELIPFHHSELLARESERTQLHPIKDAGHNDLSLFSDYHKTIRKLLSSVK